MRDSGHHPQRSSFERCPFHDNLRYKIMRAYVVKFEALVRGWLGRRQAEQRRFYIQRLGEDRATGAVRWIQLYRKREQEELLKGARLGDLGTNLELQQVPGKSARGAEYLESQQ